MLQFSNLKTAIIGLGYVGLPLAVEFGKQLPIEGGNIQQKHIQKLQSGQDHTLEESLEELKQTTQLSYSANLEHLSSCNFFIVTELTSIDEFKHPDLPPKAFSCIGDMLQKGDVVVYESTIYPGTIEEVCIPVLEQVSGLKFNQDFFTGHGSEQINLGDELHHVTNILKVTSRPTPEVADFADIVYQLIVTVGTDKAPSIEFAEAAKVIENIQRDVNIALINECAVVFNKSDIDIILAIRCLNDCMCEYVATQLIKELVKPHIQVEGAKKTVKGLDFEQKFPDIYNTKIIDIVKALKEYDLDIYDSWVDTIEATKEYGIDPVSSLAYANYEVIILAFTYDQFKHMSIDEFKAVAKEKYVLYDLKYILNQSDVGIRL